MGVLGEPLPAKLPAVPPPPGAVLVRAEGSMRVRQFVPCSAGRSSPPSTRGGGGPSGAYPWWSWLCGGCAGGAILVAEAPAPAGEEGAR